MWQAKIDSKKFIKGFLVVGVVYSHDIPSEDFSESYSIRENSDLDNLIVSRLNQLNNLDESSVILGNFVPKPPIMSSIAGV